MGSHSLIPAFGLLAFATAPALALDPPNLIVILADDMGWADVGPYDHDADPLTPQVTNTPQLDLMASQGMSLSQFYVTPTCSTTRAGLLTGRHPSRMGITGPFQELDPNGMDLGEITIAEALGAAGYRTALIGKWHLGEPVQFLPTNQGFDSFYGPPYSNDIQPFYLLRDEVIVNANPDQAQLTADYTIEAKLEITAAVNAAEPFFLFLSHSMPHVPVYASPAFTGSTGRGLYADAVSELDWSVGEILAHLQALGIDSETLVVFMSDNGPWDDTHGPEPWSTEPWRWVGGSALPLRGSKATLWEGGVRAPFVARMPGAISPGTTNDELATVMDLFTTFVALGGGQLPTDRVLDGQDLYPLLTSAGARPVTPAFQYLVAGGVQQGTLSLEAARSGKWKQHFRPGFIPTHLFDLQADPSETTPLVLPKTTAWMRALALEFHCTLSDPPFLFPSSANVALGRPVVVSSAEPCEIARNCVDGVNSTRWHSELGDNQWLELDLGADMPIAWVGLRWGGDFASHYRVRVSPDGISWTTVFGTAGGNGGLDGILLDTSGRYLRLRCIESSLGTGYDLRELQVLTSGMQGKYFKIP